MKNNFLLFLIITLAAFFIRLEYNRTTFVDGPLRGDAKYYVIYGYNLYEHQIFSKKLSDSPEPDSFWAPGFPFMIALSMLAGGPKGGYYSIMQFIHALLGALIIPLLYLAGKEVIPRWAVILSAILTAFSPHLVSIGHYLLTETLFSFFLFASLLSFYKGLKNNNTWIYALSGALFGYTYLINPIIFFLPFIFILLTGFQRKIEHRPLLHLRYIKKSTVFLIVFLVFSGGWSLRNAIVVQQKSESSKERALMNLVQGSHPEYFQEWRAGKHRHKDSPVLKEFFDSKNSLSSFVDSFYSRFREDPVKYLTWYLFKKPYLLWSWNIQIGQGDIYVYPTPVSLYSISRSANMTKQVMRVIHPVILLLMLSGLYFLANQIFRKETSLSDIPVPFYITVLYVTFIYVIFQPDPRYAIPLRPEMYLVAMWSLAEWIKFYLHRKKK